MKVDFNDCEFGCFEPHHTIVYNGKEYRAIDVPVFYDDGKCEWHTIAERDLELALARDAGGSVADINCDLDDGISYYAENNDGVYYILETITGEEITGRVL